MLSAWRTPQLTCPGDPHALNINRLNQQNVHLVHMPHLYICPVKIAEQNGHICISSSPYTAVRFGLSAGLHYSHGSSVSLITARLLSPDVAGHKGPLAGPWPCLPHLLALGQAGQAFTLTECMLATAVLLTPFEVTV